MKTRAYNRFDDKGLDELYRSTPPGEERTVTEIARAAGVSRQVIYDYERRALAKLKQEFEKRAA